MQAYKSIVLAQIVIKSRNRIRVKENWSPLGALSHSLLISGGQPELPRDNLKSISLIHVAIDAPLSNAERRRGERHSRLASQVDNIATTRKK
jgi:hypothetical protein